MTITYPRVSFGLYGLAIKKDSTPAYSGTLQPFSKIADINLSNASAKPYATYEPDFWVLDGNYKLLPAITTAVHVGLMSAEMTDASGNFASPPTLTLTFSTVHTTDGLVLRFSEFSGDYANGIKVQAYDSSNVLISEYTYSPTSTEFSTGQAIANFKKIIITFNSTNKPYRYLRVSSLDYGTLINFEKSDIKSATVVEELNPISVELPAGTLELTLHSTDATFSITNPTGLYSALQYRQPLDVREIVDGASVFIGRFYLTDWENTSETIYKFTAVDALGILDSMTYLGGLWLTAATLSDLVDAILAPIYIAYDLDTDLASIEITGWLPVCTYREAIQQIAFVCGAYVSCARSGAIKIYKSDLVSESTAYDATITSAQKGLDSSLTLKSMVTGVEITSHDYVSSSDTTTLYDGTLATGTYTIKFSQPCHNLTISGASITTSGANYAVIEVTAAGTVTLTGETYTDTTQTYSVYNTDIDTTLKTNVLTISDVTLVNASNGQDLAQRVYDYYQQRYLQKTKLFAPAIESGNVVLVDTLNSAQLRGMVEKMSLDLAGGFVAQTEITGVLHA